MNDLVQGGSGAAAETAYGVSKDQADLYARAHSPERLRQTRSFQQTLGIWIGRFGKAQEVIRELEGDNERLKLIVATLAAELPDDVVERIVRELERGAG